MLQLCTTPAGPTQRPGGHPADRRAHPRIPSSKLGITRVQISNRTGASLVDLSSGGALLELPFQLRPESRLAVQFDTAGEKLELPLQLLRCYVAELRGGVRYHAAGAFDNLLNLDALVQRASSAMQRLIASLERLEGVVKRASAQSRSDAAFHETLTDLINWLRRSESLDLVILKVKARLTQTYPSLVILPFASPSIDRLTSLECFGLTFKWKHTLSANDRRFLKANAQLVSMLEATRRELHAEDESRFSPASGRTTAARNAPKAAINTELEEGDLRFFDALILDPVIA